jgi:DNA-binding XRE family transcriptional regulator
LVSSKRQLGPRFPSQKRSTPRSKFRKGKIQHISGFCGARFLVRLQTVKRLPHRHILGESIRAHRKKARMSQEALAECSDLTAKYLGEVERGVVNISIDALVRIARALGLRADELIRGF